MINRIKKLYQKTINWLATGHRIKIAFLLSHGGLHLLVFVILAIVTYRIYIYSTERNNNVYNELNIDFAFPEGQIAHLHSMDLNIRPIFYNKYKDKFSFIVDFSAHNFNDNDFDLRCHVSSTSNRKFLIDTIDSDEPFHNLYSISFKSQDKPAYISENHHVSHICHDSICFNNVNEEKVGFVLPECFNIHATSNVIRIYFKQIKNNGYSLTLGEKDGKCKKESYVSPYMRDGKIIFELENEFCHITNTKVHTEFLKPNSNTSTTFYNPFTFDKIIPEPDEVSDGKRIVFHDSKKIQQIMDSGLLISTTNLVRKDYNNRLSILYNVLIGTLIAFLLEIFVQLVIKWRNLARKH